MEGPGWDVVGRIVELRLARARHRLEGELDPIATARERAAIRELKFLQKLPLMSREDLARELQLDD